MTARDVDRVAMSGYFLAGPVLLAIAYFRGQPVFPAASLTTRGVIIYGFATPFVGVLLALRHRRARFATYVFLTVDIARSIARGVALAVPLPLITDVVVLLYLQTPRMKRIYPRIDPREVRARWRRILKR